MAHGIDRAVVVSRRQRHRVDAIVQERERGVLIRARTQPGEVPNPGDDLVWRTGRCVGELHRRTFSLRLGRPAELSRRPEVHNRHGERVASGLSM